MERLLIGKSSFSSKDKANTFYKITVLEPLTEMQFQNGQRGYNASDYFVPKTLYDTIPNSLEAMPQVEMDFDVVAGKAYVKSVKVIDASSASSSRSSGSK